MISWIKMHIGLLLAKFGGVQYSNINGELWLKELGWECWQKLSEHLKKEHPKDYMKYYGN